MAAQRGSERDDADHCPAAIVLEFEGAAAVPLASVRAVPSHGAGLPLPVEELDRHGE